MSAPRKTPKTKAAAATAAAASSSGAEASTTGRDEGLRKRVGFPKDDEQRTTAPVDAKVSSALRTVAVYQELCVPREIDTADR